MSMSLFGSLMGDMDDDPFFGSAMHQMRSMDHMMMNSMFQDPFAMGGMDVFREFDNQRARMRSMMSPFGMPMMPNFNRLMSSSLGSMGPMGPMGNGANFTSSSTVISMSSGPDGRPQVYKETSSTKVAPGGIKETQRTVSDSVTGTKKMAIGHHIGERAHIIEKEQNMHTGDREERQDFINLDEDEADDFNREWQTKTRCVSEIPRISAPSARNRHSYGGYPAVPAITAGSSNSRRNKDRSTTPLVTARRTIRSPKLAITASSSSSQRTPYSPSAPSTQPRKSKNVKIVSGTTPSEK